MSQESYEFSADINQLMHLIVNAFYSKKEVFLRELLSNASDALDKIRYESLTNSDILGDNKEMKIQILPNKENKTLTISDFGVGMTKDDLINNLGTVAKSGTKAFMEKLKQDDSKMDLIGQFGVGFYSAYLVADKVSVLTKNNNDATFVWESSSNGKYSISEVENSELGRGTHITLHLKDECESYLDETELRNLVKKHSQYISFPIELMVEKTKEVESEANATEANATEADATEANATEANATEANATEANATEANATEANATEANSTEAEANSTEANATEANATEANATVAEANATEATATEASEDVQIEDVDENEAEKKKTETVTYKEWEVINEQKPIWTKKSDDVTKEEYESFYKNLSGDNGNYSQVKHFSVEGNVEFNSILFIPESKPFDMFGGGNEEKINNKIKLYVRRVFILDNCKDLLPEYLSFVNGLVDSNDLPLNVSREMIQESKILRVIKKQLVKKTIEMMEELSEDKEKYKKFYESFSKNIKLGVYEDNANRKKLSALLRYQSTTSGEEHTSLDEYISRMPEEQKSIYYLSGESVKSIENSPFLEQLKKKGYEVLLMTDAIDEYMLQQMKDYNEKTLVDVSKEDLGLDQSEDEKKEFEEQESTFKGLCEHVKEILGERVSKVSLSNRIVNTPCVLSSSKFGWSANMQRIMKAQALADNGMHQFMMGQKIFEINPSHKTINGLKERYDNDKNDPTIKDLVWLLYESSMLNCGFALDDPSMFTQRINRIINLGLNIDDDEEVVDETYQEEAVVTDNVTEENMEQVD